MLPVPIHEVDYEETVADLEAVARRLVAACGLEWEPACLEFHRTERPVRTASVDQVRSPSTRIGRPLEALRAGPGRLVRGAAARVGRRNPHRFAVSGQGGLPVASGRRYNASAVTQYGFLPEMNHRFS